MMRILATVLAFIFATSVYAAGKGNEGGHGGDDVGLEFQQAFLAAWNNVRTSGGSEFRAIKELNLGDELKNASVIVVDDPLIVHWNGIDQESVAVNDSKTRVIKINRSRWNRIVSDRIKEGVALHEVLGLRELETTGQYQYSGFYLSLFGYDPDVFFEESPGMSFKMPSAVSKIYKYQCRRRFLEGEGVDLSSISCVAGQHLGYYLAQYSFYLFRTPTGGNFSSKALASYFSDPVCGIANVSKYECDLDPQLRYGLSERAEGDFVVGITMTARPEGPNAQAFYGFAGLPNAQGKCARGLVKARPYVSQPESMTEPYPSSFININNSLNNLIVEVDGEASDPLLVWRVPATEPCDANGRCSWPRGEAIMTGEFPYAPLSPVVCVIPKRAL